MGGGGGGVSGGVGNHDLIKGGAFDSLFRNKNTVRIRIKIRYVE